MISTGDESEDIRKLLASHKLLVDTCFLMNQNLDKFLNEFREIFAINKIMIPLRVVQELQRIVNLNDYRLDAVTRALKSVQLSISEGIVEIRNEKSDEKAKVADHVIVRVVLQHIVQHNMLVLTQDNGLMRDLFNIRKSESFSVSRSLVIVRLHMKTGKPQVIRKTRAHSINNNDHSSDTNNYKSNSSKLNRSVKPYENPFEIKGSVEPNIDALVFVNEQLDVGSFVYVNRSERIRLVSRFAAGGEGTVFETDYKGLVCKIYHAEKLDVGKQKKIELMVTRVMPDSAICWPISSLYDSSGVFRGFLMSRATGKPLGHGLFMPYVWSKEYPKWDRKMSVQLALAIVNKIRLLHSAGVLLGDINPLNILVENQNTAYFVDCDSYQVEGFPCPVGSVNFVASEIQGQDFRKFLRTEQHELFAVATLLFMILIPGKTPYSHQGGTDGCENIKKRHFPYPLSGVKRSKDVPGGAWRFCWSHLNRPLKESFFQSFHVDYKDLPRVSLDDWTQHLKEYYRILSQANLVFTGPAPRIGFDLSILPHNFRYLEGSVPPSNDRTDLQNEVMRNIGKMSNAYHQHQGYVGFGSISNMSKNFMRSTQASSVVVNQVASGTSKNNVKSKYFGGPCFVATAVFQNEQHPAVQKLRLFREVILRKSRIGCIFIELYNTVGPFGANLVRSLPWSRMVLMPLFKLLGLWLFDFSMFWRARIEAPDQMRGQ